MFSIQFRKTFIPDRSTTMDHGPSNTANKITSNQMDLTIQLKLHFKIEFRDSFDITATQTDQLQPLHGMLHRSSLHICNKLIIIKPNHSELIGIYCQKNWPFTFTYSVTKRNEAVCKTIAPSPAGFDVFMHLAQNPFSWIDVTMSVLKSNRTLVKLNIYFFPIEPLGIPFHQAKVFSFV